jgi:hypothetical protein
MRRCCLQLLVVAIVLPLRAAEPAEKHDGKLLVLGIAINQFPDKKTKETIASYNYCAQDFTKALHDGGAPVYRQVETRLLLGRDVTHARCLLELARLSKRATRQDVVALGIFAHGLLHAKQGWGIETADKQMLWGRDIKAVLARLPCPVLVVVETCTSAAFVKANRSDTSLSPNVTAMCACRVPRDADNHLSIAISEGLWGKADLDKDGFVERSELLLYVRRRQAELSADEKPAEKAEPPVFVEAKAGPPLLPLTKANGELAAVAVKGEWYQARVLKKLPGDKFRIHVLGWDTRPGPFFLTDEVDRAHVCLPADPPPVRVEVDGKVRLARLLSKDGKEWKVQYLDGGKREEKVAKDRITQLFGEEPVARKKRPKKK